MKDSFLIPLLVALLGSILTFLLGIFFSGPIKQWFDNVKQRYKLRREEPIIVRIFFILCPFSSTELKNLLLLQNHYQNLFEFDLADWELYSNRHLEENRLRSLQTNSRLEFVNAFQDSMQSFNESQKNIDKTGINIAVTDLPFPRNYYTWNTEDRNGIVIGINSLKNLFNKDPFLVNYIILRVIQRMVLYALKIDGLVVHHDTRGCLFDFTENLLNIEFSAYKVNICKECEKTILKSKKISFHKIISNWIKKSRKDKN